jgi:hypothetical protein
MKADRKKHRNKAGSGASHKQEASPRVESPTPTPDPTRFPDEAAARRPFEGLLTAICAVLMPFIFALVSFRFVNIEKGAIYLSDFATYWSQVVSIANDIRNRGVTLELLSVLYDSVGKNHYNFLPVIPLVPFQFLADNSRAAFVGGVAFIFVGAAALACSRLIHLRHNFRYGGCVSVLCGGLMMVSTCAIWWPVYRGYVDASALACALACVAALFYKDKPEERLSLAALAGFLLGFSVILRAYFAFYALTFSFLLAAYAGVQIFRATDLSQRKPFIKFLAAFALGAAFNILLFPKFIALSLSMDQGIHAAFLSGRSFFGDVWYLCTYFGAVPIALFLFGIACNTSNKGIKAAVWIPVGASALGGILFLRNQFFGEHHRYMLLVGYFTCVALGLRVSLTQPQRRLHAAFLGLFAMACVGCLSDIQGAGSKGVFNGMASPEPMSGEPATRSPLWVALFGFSAPRPMTRSDAGEFSRMYAYLDSLIAKDPNARIYVLASGWSLSDMVIYASLLPSPGLQFRSARNLLPVHQVDSRDGVPSNLLAATYVLTSETVETHLKPGSQMCVEVPWRQFHEERGYARGFEKLPERFHLEKGVEALVFRRTRQSFPLEVKELEQDLKAAGMIK